MSMRKLASAAKDFSMSILMFCEKPFKSFIFAFCAPARLAL